MGHSGPRGAESNNENQNRGKAVVDQFCSVQHAIENYCLNRSLVPPEAVRSPKVAENATKSLKTASF